MVAILIIYSFIALLFLFYTILASKEFFSQLISFKKKTYSNVYWFDLFISTLIFFILSISVILNSISIISEKFIVQFLYRELLIYFPLFISNNFSLNIINTLLILINRKIAKNKLYNLYQHIFNHFILFIIDTLFIFFLVKTFDIPTISLLINFVQLFLFTIHIITILFLSKFYKNILYSKKNAKRNIMIKAIHHLFFKSICDIILNLPSILKCLNKKIHLSILEPTEDNNLDNADDYELYFNVYYFSNIFFAFAYFCIFCVILMGINSEFNFPVNKIMYYLFCFKNYSFYSKKTKKTRVDIPEKITNSTLSNKTNNTKYPFYLKSTFTSLLPGNDLGDYEYTPCNFFIIFKLLNLYYKKNKNSYLNLEEDNDSNNEKNKKNTILNSPNRNNPRKSAILNNIPDFLKRKNDFKRIYSTDNLNKNNNDNNNDSSNICGTLNLKNSKRKESENYNNISRASNVNTSIFRNSSCIDMKEKINNFSRITLSNIQKQNPHIKYSIDDIMNNIEDVKMKNFFMEKLLMKLIRTNINETNTFSVSYNTINTIKEKDEWKYDSINNISNITNGNNNNFLEFVIESLTNNLLFDLFPYYDIKIKDIIKSLDITDNMDLFSKYSEKKQKNSSFNLFNTKDALLSFEIYDKNFMHYDELKYFITEYKKYLIERISNFSYSFLPLIIGIFNVKYLSYNKIIILYRNPLSFSYNINFHFWLNICFAVDKLKQVETSTNNNEILDLNEIEINNNIILEENEYKDSVEVLESDLLFLQNNLEFNFDFNLNLFIINDSQKNNILSENQSYFNEPVSNNQRGLDSIIQEANMSCLGNDFFNNKLFNFSKRYYGSEDLSSLEKLYMNSLTTNRYIFKIYFKDIFKRKIIENQNEESTKLINERNKNINTNDSYDSEEDNLIKIYNKRFCEKIKTKLIRNIGKATIDETLKNN